MVEQQLTYLLLFLVGVRLTTAGYETGYGGGNGGSNGGAYGGSNGGGYRASAPGYGSMSHMGYAPAQVGAGTTPPYGHTGAAMGTQGSGGMYIPEEVKRHEALTQVALIINCRELPPNRPATGEYNWPSYPMAVVKTKLIDEPLHEAGRTEWHGERVNPNFTSYIVFDYRFEEERPIRVEVYDVVVDPILHYSHPLPQTYIGAVDLKLNDLCTGDAIGREISKPLTDMYNNPAGTCDLRAEEVDPKRDLLNLKFSAENLPLTQQGPMVQKPSPYLVIKRFDGPQNDLTVHKTEIQNNTANPTWKPFSVPIRRLCGRDENKDIALEVHREGNPDADNLIGSVHARCEDFKKQNRFRLTKDKKPTDSIVVLQTSSSTQTYTFLDFIKGGTKLDFAVAIDFTASNDGPKPSLHALLNGRDNHYQTALRAVGKIIEPYDSDKSFMAFGFGAKSKIWDKPPHKDVMTDGVNHEFALTLNEANPEVCFIEGILDEYAAILRKLGKWDSNEWYKRLRGEQVEQWSERDTKIYLWGDTQFAPIIKKIAAHSSQYMDGSQFTILLMTTDGKIDDKNETKMAIIEASKLPMSIIIVGIGNHDFKDMHYLDSDDALLQHTKGGKTYVAERDIVQFVPLRDFIDEDNPDKSRAGLAREVLYEVPDQLTGFMESRHIAPGPGKVGNTIGECERQAASMQMQMRPPGQYHGNQNSGVQHYGQSHHPGTAPAYRPTGAPHSIGLYDPNAWTYGGLTNQNYQRGNLHGGQQPYQQQQQQQQPQPQVQQRFYQ